MWSQLKALLGNGPKKAICAGLLAVESFFGCSIAWADPELVLAGDFGAKSVVVLGGKQYTLVLTNNLPEDATNVVIEDAIRESRLANAIDIISCTTTLNFPGGGLQAKLPPREPMNFSVILGLVPRNGVVTIKCIVFFNEVGRILARPRVQFSKAGSGGRHSAEGPAVQIDVVDESRKPRVQRASARNEEVNTPDR